jgi:hypothetical protein
LAFWRRTLRTQVGAVTTMIRWERKQGRRSAREGLDRAGAPGDDA